MRTMGIATVIVLVRIGMMIVIVVAMAETIIDDDQHEMIMAFTEGVPLAGTTLMVDVGEMMAVAVADCVMATAITGGEEMKSATRRKRQNAVAFLEDKDSSVNRILH